VEETKTEFYNSLLIDPLSDSIKSIAFSRFLKILQQLRQNDIFNKKTPFWGKKSVVTLLYKPVGNIQPPWRWNGNSPLGQATADINIQKENVR
jgi:hypothetical protein